jgi:hypothetical protein
MKVSKQFAHGATFSRRYIVRLSGYGIEDVQLIRLCISRFYYWS